MTELNFNFKGERKYIQGPDVYNALINTFKDARLYEISFHQIMTHNILLGENEPKDPKDLYFIAKFKSNNSDKILFGIKNPNSMPTKSVPYPEEKIIAKTKLDIIKQEITLAEPSGFSFMEEMIALNKHLLLNVIKDKKGKWYFAKLVLNDDFKAIYPLTMHFKIHFNFLLAKSEIYVGNECRGGGIVFFGSPQM